eukprot:CAMPEP_0183715380 /NCGR_PEP_ID=MMETSP0737-20130205/9622_1 /TAXON_ID=385413 /ORGANISM="Thalassiosira miniscula, Strain CCMP1093" /LENGTH=1459 /DNA_ID=CAMNT_0025944471 /DNA_START=135 /DNA_END=4514 /DNA_ORIENTATION=-
MRMPRESSPKTVAEAPGVLVEPPSSPRDERNDNKDKDKQQPPSNDTTMPPAEPSAALLKPAAKPTKKRWSKNHKHHNSAPLFASHFDAPSLTDLALLSSAEASTSASGDGAAPIARRSKRKLKAITRFDPQSKYIPPSKFACRTGDGFLCPRCSYVCSYDSRRCEECALECYYEAGVGVVTLKERRVSTGEVKKKVNRGKAKKKGRASEGVPLASSSLAPLTNTTATLMGGVPDAGKRGTQSTTQPPPSVIAEDDAFKAICAAIAPPSAVSSRAQAAIITFDNKRSNKGRKGGSHEPKPSLGTAGNAKKMQTSTKPKNIHNNNFTGGRANNRNHAENPPKGGARKLPNNLPKQDSATEAVGQQQPASSNDGRNRAPRAPREVPEHKPSKASASGSRNNATTNAGPSEVPDNPTTTPAKVSAEKDNKPHETNDVSAEQSTKPSDAGVKDPPKDPKEPTEARNNPTNTGAKASIAPSSSPADGNAAGNRPALTLANDTVTMATSLEGLSLLDEPPKQDRSEARVDELARSSDPAKQAAAGASDNAPPPDSMQQCEGMASKTAESNKIIANTVEGKKNIIHNPQTQGSSRQQQQQPRGTAASDTNNVEGQQQAQGNNTQEVEGGTIIIHNPHSRGNNTQQQKGAAAGSTNNVDGGTTIHKQDNAVEVALIMEDQQLQDSKREPSQGVTPTKQPLKQTNVESEGSKVTANSLNNAEEEDVDMLSPETERTDESSPPEDKVDIETQATHGGDPTNYDDDVGMVSSDNDKSGEVSPLDEKCSGKRGANTDTQTHKEDVDMTLSENDKRGQGLPAEGQSQVGRQTTTNKETEGRPKDGDLCTRREPSSPEEEVSLSLSSSVEEFEASHFRAKVGTTLGKKNDSNEVAEKEDKALEKGVDGLSLHQAGREIKPTTPLQAGNQETNKRAKMDGSLSESRAEISNSNKEAAEVPPLEGSQKEEHHQPETSVPSSDAEGTIVDGALAAEKQVALLVGGRTPEETPEGPPCPSASLLAEAGHATRVHPEYQLQLKELQAKYDALMERSLQSEKEHKSTITKLEAKLAVKDQEVTCADATAFSLRGRISTLEDDLASMTVERDELVKVQNARGVNAGLGDNPSLPHHLSPMNMPEDVSNCSSEMEELQSKMEEVMDQRDSAEEQVKELLGVQLQKDELLVKLQEANCALSISESKRKKEKEDFEERAKAAVDDVTSKKRRICHLEASLNVMVSQRDRANSRVRALLFSGAGRPSIAENSADGGDGGTPSSLAASLNATIEKVLSTFDKENATLVSQLHELRAEVGIIKFEKADAVKQTAKWKATITELENQMEKLQTQNIKLQQRHTFEAAFQSEHDGCLRELEEPLTPMDTDNLNDNNNLNNDSLEDALNNNLSVDAEDTAGIFLEPPLPPPLDDDDETNDAADDEEEEEEEDNYDDDDETKMEELTNTLDSLNEFENFLMDLGLEDVQVS